MHAQKIFFTKTSVAFLVALCIFVFFPDAGHAIGVSPHKFPEGSVFRGASQEHAFRLVRAAEDSSGDLYYKAVARGIDAQFLQVPTGPIVIPAGAENTEFTVLISPGNSANGTYSAQVDLIPVSAPTEQVGSGATASVITGATLLLDWRVTDEQQASFVIKSLQISPFEVTQPITLRYALHNTGNVKIRPSVIRIRLVDVVDPSIVYEIEVQANDDSYNIPYVDPGQTMETIFQTPHSIPAGKYTIQVEFEYEQEVVYVGNLLDMRVFPEGGLEQKGEIKEVDIPKDEYRPGESIPIKAVINNTGNSEIQTTLIAEIVKDNVVVSIEESPVIIVPPGQSRAVEHAITIAQPGNHIVNVLFNINGEKKLIKTMLIMIQDIQQCFSGYGLAAIAIGYLISWILLLLFFLLWRRKKKDECDIDDVECLEKKLARAKKIQGIEEEGVAVMEGQENNFRQ